MDTPHPEQDLTDADMLAAHRSLAVMIHAYSGAPEGESELGKFQALVFGMRVTSSVDGSMGDEYLRQVLAAALVTIARLQSVNHKRN